MPAANASARADPISDYAVIGDCRSAALVSRRGSIDWLCWPRFDSPSCFGGLLDPDQGGRFAITPLGSFQVTRRYCDGTNVLETQFHGNEGTATLTDFMPLTSDQDRTRELAADHELLRIITGVEGQLRLRIDFSPRPAFGLGRFRINDRGAHGIRIESGGGVLLLRSEWPLVVTDAGAHAELLVSAGQRIRFSLSYTEEAPAVIPLLGTRIDEERDRAVAGWQRWNWQLRYRGPYASAVTRSALTLKLLCYAPSGAVVAAPTTSLPERVGGDLNWDYRYCWLRDASLTVRALMGVGYHQEAQSFASWLLHTTRLTRPRLSVLYDVYGVLPPRERALRHWKGYGGSRPVRIGNAAMEQQQLDMYSEVIDAAMHLVHGGYRFDRESVRMLLGFGKHIVRHWNEPDSGIWEVRGTRRRHTMSLALGAVALHKLAGLTSGDQRSNLLQAALGLRGVVEQRGWNAEFGSYVDELGGTSVDASLLLLPIYEYAPAHAPRIAATIRRVLRELGAGPGLLYRNLSGRLPPEGAFGICSFWATDALARMGARREAERTFAATLSCGNDLGLFGEEVDPNNREALGNFPQGFTHVGLINAALELQRSPHATQEPPATERHSIEPEARL